MKNIYTYSIIFFIDYFGISCQRSSENSIKQIHYRGIIQEKFEDPSNHMLRTFKIKTEKSIFENTTQEIEGIWEYSNEGDSIIKEKGVLVYIVKKNNKERRFLYKY